jgi:hypothetical protein
LVIARKRSDGIKFFLANVPFHFPTGPSPFADLVIRGKKKLVGSARKPHRAHSLPLLFIMQEMNFSKLSSDRQGRPSPPCMPSWAQTTSKGGQMKKT